MVRFGPAGRSQSVDAFDAASKGTSAVLEHACSLGLTAFEYQCGHGVRIGDKTAKEFGAVAASMGISLSLHAPYYISLSGLEAEKREKSVAYILDSARAADAMGATRIVVHSGTAGKLPRVDALSLAKDTLMRSLCALDAEGLGHIHICPETMGKINQLGDLDEVMDLCSIDERLIPCIDFGHLNARTLGSLSSESDFAAVLDHIEDCLGRERATRFHAHFSKIEYTEKGGEKRHLTFADTQYGPPYEPLMELVAQRNLAVTFICESAGTQAEDAAAMKACYDSFSAGV